jgi:hypothetical protein
VDQVVDLREKHTTVSKHLQTAPPPVKNARQWLWDKNRQKRKRERRTRWSRGENSLHHHRRRLHREICVWIERVESDCVCFPRERSECLFF